MSANITILEGGKARGFTAKKMLVPLQAGGECPFVPEDDVKLGVGYFSKNGRRKAKKDGLYAWSQLVVSVPDGESVTGKGQDGKTYIVTVDINGNLVETEVSPE